MCTTASVFCHDNLAECLHQNSKQVSPSLLLFICNQNMLHCNSQRPIYTAVSIRIQLWEQYIQHWLECLLHTRIYHNLCQYFLPVTEERAKTIWSCWKLLRLSLAEQQYLPLQPFTLMECSNVVQAIIHFNNSLPCIFEYLECPFLLCRSNFKCICLYQSKEITCCLHIYSFLGFKGAWNKCKVLHPRRV